MKENTNIDGLTFEAFMSLVDSNIELSIGLTHLDLPSLPYYDMWESDSTPEETAQIAIEEIFDGMMEL